LKQREREWMNVQKRTVSGRADAGGLVTAR
jgi:hypothetical protein